MKQWSTPPKFFPTFSSPAALRTRTFPSGDFKKVVVNQTTAVESPRVRHDGDRYIYTYMRSDLIGSDLMSKE